jgi:hypothetical protein
MTIDENKLQILKKVEDGTLSVEEGADLLSILDYGTTMKPDTAVHAAVEIPDEKKIMTTSQVPAGWKALWSLFIWIGVAAMGGTGYWLYSSYARSGLGWGFWFALIFLSLSIAIVFFGWRLIAGRWLVASIRANEKDNSTRLYKFWAPLPIHMGIWVFQTFGQYMPEKVIEKHYDQVLADLDKSLKGDEIFQIDINGEGHKKSEFSVRFDTND